MAGKYLASLIRSARTRTLNSRTGKTYTQEGLADAVGTSRETIKAIENEETQTVGPDLAKAFEDVLGISVLEIVRSMGFEIAFEGIRDEEDAVVLAAYQEASDDRRRIARSALGLDQARTNDGRLESLRRLAATDRQDRQETQG